MTARPLRGGLVAALRAGRPATRADGPLTVPRKGGTGTCSTATNRTGDQVPCNGATLYSVRIDDGKPVA